MCDKLAPAVGPYSTGIENNGTIYISGQLPVDINGNIPEGVTAQAHQSLQNIGKILETLNLSYDNVLKTTVFLADIKDFVAVNEVYQEYFKAPYPARSAFAVAALPKGALVEIECIAGK